MLHGILTELTVLCLFPNSLQAKVKMLETGGQRMAKAATTAAKNITEARQEEQARR